MDDGGVVGHSDLVAEAERAIGSDLEQDEDVLVDDRLLGQVRPFWQGFGLTVVTLGIYSLFWHPIVNGEVARQTGRRETGNGIWLAMVLVLVLDVLLAFVRFPIGTMVPSVWSDPVGMVFALVSQGLFIAFAFVQGRHLNRGYALLGSKQRAPVGIFVTLETMVWLLYLTELVPFLFVGVAIAMLAYGVLQSAYNEFWQGMKRHLRSPLAVASEPDDVGQYHTPT